VSSLKNANKMFFDAQAFNYPLCWNTTSAIVNAIRSNKRPRIDIKVPGVDCFPDASLTSMVNLKMNMKNAIVQAVTLDYSNEGGLRQNGDP